MNILQKIILYNYKVYFLSSFLLSSFPFFPFCSGMLVQKVRCNQRFCFASCFYLHSHWGRCCWVSVLSLLLVQTNTLLHPLKIGQFVSKQATQHAHSSMHQRAWLQISPLQWYLFSNAGCNYDFVNTAKLAFFAIKKILCICCPFYVWVHEHLLEEFVHSCELSGDTEENLLISNLLTNTFILKASTRWQQLLVYTESRSSA